MAQSIEQLSFELTAGALAEQERAVAGLRTCAGTVLGVASIAGSLLGTRVSSIGLGAWAGVAMVAFISCFVSALYILLPRGLTLAVGGYELLAECDRRELDDVEDAYRAMGSWIEIHLDLNRPTIKGMGNWLSLSCALLAIEILSSALSLAS